MCREAELHNRNILKIGGMNMGLVVASAAKDVIKKAEMNCGGDLCDALDKKIEQLINDAVARAKSNDRKTVRAGDL